MAFFESLSLNSFLSFSLSKDGSLLTASKTGSMKILDLPMVVTRKSTENLSFVGISGDSQRMYPFQFYGLDEGDESRKHLATNKKH